MFLVSCEQFNSRYQIEYTDIIYNYDGDTILIYCLNGLKCEKKGLSVRVRHVDTPEIKGRCEYERKMAYRAKEFTNKALKRAHSIVLSINQLNMYDKYDRLLADILIDGQSLGKMLVENNLGRSYDGGHRDGWCSSDKSW
ncbi:MAG: thermonuclease family protein [Pseudomonadota bacterium]